MIRICLCDLIKRPVLDFKDKETGLVIVQYEIWFLAFYIRSIPGDILRIRLGDPFKGPVKLPLAFRGEAFNIPGIMVAIRKQLPMCRMFSRSRLAIWSSGLAVCFTPQLL